MPSRARSSPAARAERCSPTTSRRRSRRQGVPAASPLTRVYDVSGVSGGPILRDRLWYFANAHAGGSTRESSVVYYNLERRRSGALALRAGLQPPRVLRPDVRERQRPAHVAGHAAQPCERLLGRAEPVPELHRGHARSRGAAADFARGRRRPRTAAPRVAGQVVVADHEPTVRRGRLRRDVVRRRQLRAVAQSDARSGSRGRTVRERLRGQRQHTGTGLSIAGFQRGLHRLVSVGRLAVLRHRRAQR